MKTINSKYTAAQPQAACRISDLYERYDDYVFNWTEFLKDPEGYHFTEDDIMYLNLQELERYEAKVQMSPYEKRLLRNWVASGHSVYETSGSRYIPDPVGCDFLDVYRMDRELRQELKGKTKAEQEEYLKSYTGYTDDAPDEEWEPELTNGLFPRKKGMMEHEYMKQRENKQV